MNTFEKFKTDIKKDLMMQIMINVKHGSLNRQDTRLVSRDFMHALDKAIDEQSLLSELFNLIEIHPEILHVFTAHADSFYAQQSTKRIKQAHIYLQNGFIDEAVESLKGKN